MNTYQYKAKNKRGNVIEGKIKGESIEYVYDFLMNKDLYPINIRAYKKSSNLKINEFKKIDNSDWLIFLKNITYTLKSGQNLLNSIITAKEQIKNYRLKSMLNGVCEDIENGVSFSEALKNCDCKEKVLVSMIEAGEVSGRMINVLDKLIVYYEKQIKYEKKFKGAAIYPLTVAVFCISVLVYLINKILPDFLTMISKYGNVNIPKKTLELMRFNEYISKNYIFIFILIFVIIISFKLLISFKHIRPQIDMIKCKMPFINKLYLKPIEVRILTILYLFIDNGISIDNSLKFLEDFIPNVYIKNKIKIVLQKIECGFSFGESISAIDIFNDSFIEAIESGEKSGSLPETLKYASEFYEFEIQNELDKMTSLIEPLLMVILCISVGYIIIVSVMPLLSIYEMQF